MEPYRIPGWKRDARHVCLKRLGNTGPEGKPAVVPQYMGLIGSKYGQDCKPSLTVIGKLVIFSCSSESGGIGRRTGLRNQRLWYGGSTPPSRTTGKTAPASRPECRLISYPYRGNRPQENGFHRMTVLLKMFQTRKVLHADQC